MKYLKWAALIIPSLVMDVLAYIMSPIIALYSLYVPLSYFSPGVQVNKSNWWYWYFLTYDNPIDGDKGHIKRWPVDGSKWTDFKRRTAWLWRNKSYNFGYYVCGVDVIGSKCKWSGQEFVESNIAGRGWQFGRDDKSFCYFAFFKYPWSKKWGVRIYLGWKYKNRQKETTVRRAMHVLFFNPFWDDDSIK